MESLRLFLRQQCLKGKRGGDRWRWAKKGKMLKERDFA